MTPKFTEHIVAFAHVLRRAGLQIGTGQILDALRAVDLVGVRSRGDLRQALQCIFVNRGDQIELFDQAFALFWKAPSKIPEFMQNLLSSFQVKPEPGSGPKQRIQQALNSQSQGQTKQSQPSEKPKSRHEFLLTYSANEVLRTKDFKDFSSQEIVEAKRMLAMMKWPVPRRITRRCKPKGFGGKQLDIRSTVRASLRFEAEPLHLLRKGKIKKDRPIVILCDISGSMEKYSKMLLHFMHAVSEEPRNVETFVFGTRLTRITRYLRKNDIDEAIATVGESVVDWSGGTRIGSALKTFNYDWSRRVLRGGAAVLIISDGWDRGDGALLEREMARLSRNCYRLIWLNPLLGFSGYEPLTRGIRTVLPYIDNFLPVHNLASLEQLGKALSSLS